MSGSTIAILVMLNNYFHDLATALFTACALTAFWAFQRLHGHAEPARLAQVLSRITGVGLFALGWILAGGVVRILAYRRYEWAEAAGRGQVAALGIKHVVLVSCVGIGLFYLIMIRKKIASLATEQEKS